jgi:hypothetical protein
MVMFGIPVNEKRLELYGLIQPHDNYFQNTLPAFALIFKISKFSYPNF